MKLTDKVREFLDEKCTAIKSDFYSAIISSLEYWEQIDKPIESPIEQLFYIEWGFIKFCKPELRFLYFIPQHQDETTEKFKIDFAIGFKQEAIDLFGYEKTLVIINPPKLGIEIDGHIWHEKTKEQVQYHKERERFLIKNGWKLLRFTGSEVYKDPGKCVKEVLEIVLKLRENYHKKLKEGFKKRKKI